MLAVYIAHLFMCCNGGSYYVVHVLSLACTVLLNQSSDGPAVCYSLHAQLIRESPHSLTRRETI